LFRRYEFSGIIKTHQYLGIRTQRKIVSRQLKIRNYWKHVRIASLRMRRRAAYPAADRETKKPDSVRTAFQRDRDRILHSKSFRPLETQDTGLYCAHRRTITVPGLTAHAGSCHKSPVLSPAALNLNEDLTEAIQSGARTWVIPLSGMKGEEGVDELSPCGFQGTMEQSLRVV